MSEPYFPTPTAKSKDSEPYRSAALRTAAAPPSGPQVVHRPDADKPLIPLPTKEAPVEPTAGVGRIAKNVAFDFAVRVLGLAIALGFIYALMAIFRGTDSRLGVPIGMFLLVAVPVGLVCILVLRIRSLVRALGRLFSSDSE